MKLLLSALILTPLLLAGCGGGNGSSLSGPNSNTQQGLGTLIVRVESASNSGVSDGAAIVTLDKGIKVVRDGKVTFYDVTPGRHFVQADSQGFSFAGESRNVDIKADKTLKITLKLSAPFATPRPTFSPFPN